MKAVNTEQVSGVRTLTLGGATEGNCEIGRALIANPPMNKIKSEMTMASAGR